mmetsp:Transcript_15708/g.34386  ORF Transcript_15708/g.34386 Transcript_15708/m.34386 type:complete len:1192 (-) Transcript_15708:127-3702(-)
MGLQRVAITTPPTFVLLLLWVLNSATSSLGFVVGVNGLFSESQRQRCQLARKPIIGGGSLSSGNSIVLSTKRSRPLQRQQRRSSRQHHDSRLSARRGGGEGDVTSQNNNGVVDDSKTKSSLYYNSSSIDAGSLSVDRLWDLLQSSSSLGLTQSQALHRLKQYGPNVLEQAKPKSLWKLVAEQFEDRLVQILLGVAVLSGIFSFLEVQQAAPGESADWWKSFVEPGVILAILVLNAVVGVVQSQSAADSLQALQDMQSGTATVIREGTTASIASSELVPGDVIEVRVGDKIPADARLISLQTSTIQLDEGSLTGESVTVGKFPGAEGTTAMSHAPIQDQKGMLFSGTMVTAGSGRALVVQTAMDTQFGKIQKGVTAAQAEAVKTPLGQRLDEFGDQLTIIIAAICLLVWIVSIPKMNDPSFGTVWEGAVYYAKVAVALGVAAIPEGLPAVITLCLSLGTRKMAERNVIVRKLPSVETLGCTSVICTDKTGTLTTNEMTAVSMVLLERPPRENSANKKAKFELMEYGIEGSSYSPEGRIVGVENGSDEVKKLPSGALADVAAVSALCNDAMIIGQDPVEEADKKKGNKKEKIYDRIGEPTEAALCILAEKIGGLFSNDDDQSTKPSVLASANVESWRERRPRVATLEFNRDRKSMSVLCKFPPSMNVDASATTNGGSPRLLVKGAPNLLIERCTHMKMRDGSVVRLNGSLRRQVNDKVSELAARPLRCLALAVKENKQLEDSLRKFNPATERDIAKHPLLSKPDTYKNIESSLTLVGIVGIKDPARPEVGESIELCSKAGIRVMMITGDARDTAVAIAKDVNIFDPNSEDDCKLKAFEGREFFQKPEQEQLHILKTGNIVFCRAEPADKQKLVKMLQSLDEIPAMTGDGVNDAPALQQAAIGVAMGITGTEVSKEAADMVLADDNFSTIVSAVEEGRRIYANMQAFICFLISCNIGEICAIFFATLAGFPEPLTAMHLLWVNLVTDGPPATALGFNPPAPDLMEAPPRPSDEPIMTRWLLIRYCLTGLYVGVATIGVFAQYYMSQGIELSHLASWSQCGEFWQPGKGATCAELFQGPGRSLPQTLSLTTLVCMEMLKALSAVSVDNSLLRVGPQSNPWLLLGVSGPFLLHLFVLYSPNLGIPALADSFGIVPLTKADWVTVAAWALPILLVDEILKAVGRWLAQRDDPTKPTR